MAHQNIYACLKWLILVAISMTWFAAHPLYAVNTCDDCHKDEKFRVQNKMLYDYYSEWKDSIHQLAGVTCTDCHGGDQGRKDKESAHKKNFSSLTASDASALRIIPERCGTCHEAVLKNFSESKHYKSLIEKGTGPHCVTCHGSMNAEVYYTSVIARTCQECHNAYTKNRPDVVGEADKILHRINVSRALKNWVSIYYVDKEPEKVEEMNIIYKDVAESWHRFDFAKLDEKSQDILSKLRSLVNKKLVEKKTMSRE